MKQFRKAVGATVVSLLAVCGVGAQPAAAGDSLGDLSGPWQLFVDDYLVASKAGLSRTYHPFQKYSGNPVIVADQPWEGTIVYIYGTVLPDEAGSGYRMWYHTMRATADDGCNILYAISGDGIHWTKPSLGIRSWNGSTANNMFFTRPNASGLTSVMQTPWDPDPARRYKLMSVYGGGYYGAWSSDGIHVTDVPNNPVFTQGSDVGQFLWDPHTQQYVGYVKNGLAVSGLARRVVARITTDDIQYWPAPRLIMAPDDFDDRWAPAGTVQRTHFYGLSAFAYESMYVGFLWIFRATDVDGYYIGPVFAEIVTSHDGIHWLREEGDRPPILPLGSAGTWDDGQLYTAIAPVRQGDTLNLYYGACNEVHGTGLKKTTCSIGLSTLRKDGFASLDAGATTGFVMTKRLVGAAGPLHVNFAAAPTGWLKVEALDEDGNTLPGYSQADCASLQGGSVDQVVTWGAQTQLPTGVSPLRLRFILQNASIYSFNAGDLVQSLDESAPTLGCLYTFEKNSGQTATDKLRDDGSQALTFSGAVGVDPGAGNAAFGTRSAIFGCDNSIVNTLEVAGTSNLGTQFTLAAMVKSADNRQAQLFSTHVAGGAYKTSELLFDFDPTGTAIAGLRLVCKGIEVVSSPVSFADGRYHHLAVTYFDGDVRFYLDGAEVGQAYLPGGMPVAMQRNLRVGQDVDPIDGERFVGHLDDLLVLGRALSAAEVMSLSQYGAESLFGVIDVPADLDDDADVDLSDFAILQGCFNGPNRLPACPSPVVPAPCTAAPPTPPTTVTPIAFTERWDTYAIGTADPSYNSRWAAASGAGRYEIQNTDPVYSASNSLKVAKLVLRGITHDLTPELQAAVPGATQVIGSDEHPLDLSYYVWMNTDGSTTKLDLADVFVELSQGDVRAPDADSPTVLPVIAFGMTAGLHGASFHPRFFDGKNWVEIVAVSAGTYWNAFRVQVRGGDAVLQGQLGAAGSATQTRAYTGGFNRITIRTVSNDGQRRSFDDITLSNGSVVQPCTNPPGVTSITPNTGRSGEITDAVTIAGTNFVAGQTSVSLVRSGANSIAGADVNVASDGKSLTCTFSLLGAALGPRDVLAGTPYCPSATLAGGFTVTEPLTPADADLDHDGDVDLADFAVLQSCFNGPNRPPACR